MFQIFIIPLVPPVNFEENLIPKCQNFSEPRNYFSAEKITWPWLLKVARKIDAKMIKVEVEPKNMLENLKLEYSF